MDINDYWLNNPLILGYVNNAEGVLAAVILARSTYENLLMQISEQKRRISLVAETVRFYANEENWNVWSRGQDVEIWELQNAGDYKAPWQMAAFCMEEMPDVVPAEEGESEG